MKMDVDYREGILYVCLRGEVDEHGVAALRREADKCIDLHALRCKKVVFDVKGISFMDSTGIGFLIGRYKKIMRYGVPVYITGSTPVTDKILTMSGIYTLMPKI
jgi:stage II sporulation protein AA (anti-sigma F factor antagonist)